jgi:DNA-binding IclR family transcriptional regulator
MTKIQRVFSYLRANPGEYTVFDLTTKLNVSRFTVYSALKHLRNTGEVRKVGGTSNTVWVMGEDALKPAAPTLARWWWPPVETWESEL